MRRIFLITFGSASHIAAADALCPPSALPPTWTRSLVETLPESGIDAGDIVAYPSPIAGSGDTGLTPGLNVRPHGANAPGRWSARVYPRLVAVAARSSQGTEPATSWGPGLWASLDTAPVAPANAQSWAVYAAALYLARAWHALGTMEAAQASLVSAARAASGQAPWTEETGYGILPAYALPAPGPLLGTQTLAWSLFGDPAGASITPMTLDGREGVRIVAGAGSSRMRARAVRGVPYDANRLYRVRTYMRNLSDTDTAHLVARVSESPFGPAPGEAVDADVWEMQAAPIQSGYDPSWQLRSGLVEDDAGAVLDVFVTPPLVETYTGGALSLPAIAPPDPVAPFAVTATRTAPGVYAIAWHTVPDPDAACVVSVDEVDVASGPSPQTVYLSAGAHTVRVRLLTGDVAEEHSTVAVTSDADYVPSAPVVEVGRDGDVLVIAWASVPGSTAYRVTVAPGVGEDAEVTMEDTLSPTLLAWPGAAEVRVYAVGPSGEESAPGLAYAAGSGRARVVPLW